LLRPDRWTAVRADPGSPVSSLVTLMAGVAVVSAIGDVCPTPAELKWPNDVMVREQDGLGDSAIGLRQPEAESTRFQSHAHGAGSPESGSGRRESGLGGRQSAVGSRQSGHGPAWRKLAGILAEGASEGGVLRTVVLGIGVNLRRGEAPAEVAARMVALDELMPAAITSAQALGSLVGALLTHLGQGVDLLAGGAADDVRRRWLRHAPSVEGTPVRWHADGETRRGRSAGIDDVGALRVRLDDGAHVIIHGGAIEWCLDAREA
jgi:biotin-(acetyl-CoA carboxylase) ligase